MPENFKLSVAIVTHNNGDKAAAAVTSILAHCKKYSLDLYIIDNNSSDDTLDRIGYLSGAVKIIRLDKNIGFGAAHNKVLDLIDSRYHFVVNPDITVGSDVFADIVDFMEAQDTAVMSTPDILNTDGTTQYLPKSVPTFKRLFLGRISDKVRDEYVWKNRDITEPVKIDFCSGCFFCIRADAFKQLGGFDTRYFMYLEDADLTIMAKSLGDVYFLPDIKVTHLWARESHRKLKYLLIHTVSCIKFLMKWRHTEK